MTTIAVRVFNSLYLGLLVLFKTFTSTGSTVVDAADGLSRILSTLYYPAARISYLLASLEIAGRRGLIAQT